MINKLAFNIVQKSPLQLNKFNIVFGLISIKNQFSTYKEHQNQSNHKMASTNNEVNSNKQENNKKIDDSKFVKIVEGCATMNYSKDEAVFYNKVQVFNRDMSIQVIKLFAEYRENEKLAKYQNRLALYNKNPIGQTPPNKPIEGIRILDALAATGLRSVRYLTEIPRVRHVTINDLDQKAIDVALENCTNNGIDPTRITINRGDASLYMYQQRESSVKYDVIDLDPYGSAAPFLDSAVQAIANGGLLCITCTDMTGIIIFNLLM